jgi:glutamate--cysteine ligase catalytic subunit
MKRAQKRDALLKEEFYFRKDITTCVSTPAATSCCPTCDCSAVYTPMTIDQIINGKVPAEQFLCTVGSELKSI